MFPNVLRFSASLGFTLLILAIVNTTNGQQNIVEKVDELLKILKKVDNAEVTMAGKIDIIETNVKELTAEILTIKNIEGSANTLEGQVKTIQETIKERADTLDETMNEMDTKVKTLINDVGKINHKFDSFVDCNLSDEFFIAPGTGQGQCLKVILNEGRVHWEKAKELCEGALLKLARPHNGEMLKYYFIERYGRTNVDMKFWLGATTTSDYRIKWDGQPNYLPRESALFKPEYRGSDSTKVESDHCLVLSLITGESIEYSYKLDLCTAVTAYPLCERPTG